MESCLTVKLIAKYGGYVKAVWKWKGNFPGLFAVSGSGPAPSRLCYTKVSTMEKCPGIGREKFDQFYEKYNKREFVHPDPIEFLYEYADPGDREIAGLLASSLAYGRVKKINETVRFVLGRLEKPADFLRENSYTSLEKLFPGFKYRFTTGEGLSLLLEGIKKALETYGTLNECFLAGFGKKDETVLPALSAFVEELSKQGWPQSLLAVPAKGSPCKRLNLFLRWMIRKDEVDPGGWEGVPRSKLIIPLDTHMFRVSRALYLTKQNQAGMKAALEITASFREINPEDPARYDFALTRPGILNDPGLKNCMKEHFAREVYR